MLQTGDILRIKLFKEIIAGGAFFIIRVKDNLCYTIVENLPTGGVPQGSFDYSVPFLSIFHAALSKTVRTLP